MKQINQVNVWKNGQQLTANYFRVRIVADDLMQSCIFGYYLMEGENTEYIADGTVVVNGQEYIDWQGGNDEAYNIVATKLNLTIIVNP